MTPIGVSWINLNPQIASARLRGIIPRDVLTGRGLIKQGTEAIIAAKHWFDPIRVRRSTDFMVMDVCDDHFVGKLNAQYMIACGVADVVTCNSRTMADVIQRHARKDSVVIDDPYEDEELPPTGGNGVLWFGHSANRPDLDRIIPDIKYPLTIIDSSNYSPEALDAALRACRAVIIPTGEKRAKSANRAIRAIRYGKYPVCGPMQAHDELGLSQKHILDALDAAMNTDMSYDIIKLQQIVCARFSPEKIADDWYSVIKGARRESSDTRIRKKAQG